MKRLDELSNYSDKLIDVAINYYLNDNKMAFYMILLGKGKFKVEAFPNAGHNYYEILNSIYKYKELHDDIDVKNIFENSLLLCIKYLNEISEFELIMNYLFVQLDNEKNNNVPFKIDLLKILNALKFRLTSKETIVQNESFMNCISKYEHVLEENYGHKIIK